MERIFAPLGMDSSFFKYDSSSPAAKRIPPALMSGSPIQVPSFVAHCNLYWGSPTGQVLLLSTPKSKVILVSEVLLQQQAYSTVHDLAKLVSLFLQGLEEPFNKLNIYSSSLREMLLPATVNDDQVYIFPVKTTSVFSLIHLCFLELILRCNVRCQGTATLLSCSILVILVKICLHIGCVQRQAHWLVSAVR